MNLLIKNGIIITCDSNFRIIHDGSIAVEGNRIVDIGKTSKIVKKYERDDFEIIDAKGKAVLPGFINTHSHLYQNFMKGWHDIFPLRDWIDYVLFPVIRYASTLSPSERHDFYYYSSLLGTMEAIRTGTTTLLDFSPSCDITMEVYEKLGIRGFGGITLADKWIPEDLVKPVSETLKYIRNVVEKWHNKDNGRLNILLTPSTPYICTKELLTEAKHLADELNLLISTHVAESPYEVELSKKETGLPPIKYLDSIGLLDNKLISVHNIWLTDEEINLLAKRKVHVSHNPKSNMRLASGAMQTRKFIDKGINVSLGTDGAASNDTLDMLDTARAAVLLSKVSTRNAASLVGKDGLLMATINGARALHIDKDVGSIEVGKIADIILINLNTINTTPLSDVVNTILYASYGTDVDTTIVNGVPIMREKNIMTVDTEKILETIKEKYEPILTSIYSESKREIQK